MNNKHERRLKINKSIEPNQNCYKSYQADFWFIEPNINSNIVSRSLHPTMMPNWMVNTEHESRIPLKLNTSIPYIPRGVYLLQMAALKLQRPRPSWKNQSATLKPQICNLNPQIRMAYSIPDSNAHCLKNPMPITAEGYVPASPEPGVCVPDEELFSQSQFTKNKFFNMQKIIRN